MKRQIKLKIIVGVLIAFWFSCLYNIVKDSQR